MEEKKITIVDEQGIEHEADLIFVFEAEENGQEYAVYGIEKENEETEVFVQRIEKTEDGFDQLIDITDEEENNEIKKIVAEILNQ